MLDKYCSRCDQWLPFSAFGKNKSTKDGLQYYCKTCSSTYRKEHITTEQRKKYRTENHEKHPEKNQEYKERYFKKHHTSNANYLKQWRKNNPEQAAKHQKYLTQHRQNNPEKYQGYFNNYRAKKTKNGGTFTAKQFEQVKQLFHYCCACCGKHESECGILTVDHVIPISKGGSNDITNIQALCRQCNSTKHTETTDYRKKGFLKELFYQLSFFS